MSPVKPFAGESQRDREVLIVRVANLLEDAVKPAIMTIVTIACGRQVEGPEHRSLRVGA
jgi:hypothetical protein